MTEPGLIYFTFIFFAALGVLQITAAINSLSGLFLVRNKLLSLLVGVVLTTSAFLWFLSLTKGLLLPGIEGYQQGVLFPLGYGAALLVTLVLASLFHRSRSNPSPQNTDGLDALKELTYWQALRAHLGSKAKEEAILSKLRR